MRTNHPSIGWQKRCCRWWRSHRRRKQIDAVHFRRAPAAEAAARIYAVRRTCSPINENSQSTARAEACRCCIDTWQVLVVWRLTTGRLLRDVKYKYEDDWRMWVDESLSHCHRHIVYINRVHCRDLGVLPQINYAIFFSEANAIKHICGRSLYKRCGVIKGRRFPRFARSHGQRGIRLCIASINSTTVKAGEPGAANAYPLSSKIKVCNCKSFRNNAYMLSTIASFRKPQESYTFSTIHWVWSRHFIDTWSVVLYINCTHREFTSHNIGVSVVE